MQVTRQSRSNPLLALLTKVGVGNIQNHFCYQILWSVFFGCCRKACPIGSYTCTHCSSSTSLHMSVLTKATSMLYVHYDMCILICNDLSYPLMILYSKCFFKMFSNSPLYVFVDSQMFVNDKSYINLFFNASLLLWEEHLEHLVTPIKCSKDNEALKIDHKASSSKLAWPSSAAA